MNMNIRFEYLYRDAGNYKNWGQVVFENPNCVPVIELEKFLVSDLFEQLYFIAKSIGLPDLYFPDYNLELDHGFHEFYAIAETGETSDDSQGRSIEQLIESIKSNPVATTRSLRMPSSLGTTPDRGQA